MRNIIMGRNFLKKSRFLKPTGSSLVGLVLLTGGCGPDAVKSYTVPKEQSPAAMPTGRPELATPASPTPLKWKTPAGWQEVPPATMRVASFKITGAEGKQADVSVIPLPGDAGGDFSNVNRWRGQVGLAPVTEVEFAKLAQPVAVAGQPAVLYEQAGDAQMILAAIQHRDGMAWFFKMTGDSQVVAQAKPAFVEFLKSVQFIDSASVSSQLPAGHPDVSGTMPPVAPAALSNKGKPHWTVPAGWQEVSGGQFLVAKFMIAGAGGAQATVNVSSSAGDGGGLEANVNRWRKQLGLSELTGDELEHAMRTIPIADSITAKLIETSGTDARTSRPTALVGVIVSPQAGQTWFYKLIGDATLVEKQKEAFVWFVSGVKY